MLLVNIGYKEDKICALDISKHARPLSKNDKKYKLVCAGVSSISIGLLNAIDELATDCCSIDVKELDSDLNHITVVVNNSNDVLQTILKTGVIQLETVAVTYSDYIEIRKTEV